MIRYTRDIFPRKSVSYHNVLPGTCSTKCNRKPDCTIKKSKARYCVRGCVLKILPAEHLNLCCPVVQWYTVIFILQFILTFQNQSIDFKNAFYQTYIISQGKLFNELLRCFNICGGQCDVVIILDKILYGQAEASRLWYETFVMIC